MFVDGWVASTMPISFEIGKERGFRAEREHRIRNCDSDLQRSGEVLQRSTAAA